MPTTSNSNSNSKSKAGIFSALFLIAFGLGVNYINQDRIAEAEASVNWPSVPGLVTMSEVTSHVDTSDGKNQTMYSAYVETEYEVGGTLYSTNMMNLGGTSSSSSRSGQKKKLAEYPLGQVVSVYYDPESPGYGVLEPGVPTIMKIFGIIPFVLFAAAALIIIRVILKLAGLATALGFLAAKRNKTTATAEVITRKSPPVGGASDKVRDQSPSPGGSKDGFSI